jgi:redox-sensitive bicupin YhaK (pirin superfamily)
MRKIVQIVDAQATSDGDGVKIHRLAGRRLQTALNPFLMIDEINSDDALDYIGGFPEHPHRGFETITYMKAGRMRHRDHMGNEGVIGAGDVQWMTAGAGVLHSEMPEQEQGLLHGFQIWLNLPAADKMKPAAYRDIASAEITEHPLSGGGKVRLIAGDVAVGDQQLSGVLPPLTTEPVLMDVQLAPGETVELSFKAGNSALVYIYKGQSDVLKQGQMGIYSSGDQLPLEAGPSGAQMLVLSGRPINEPVVQYGPFVMNSMEEIEQALRDLQDNRFVRGHEPLLHLAEEGLLL